MTCSEKHWHDLWERFDANRTDTIRVQRAALADVLACHGKTPEGLIAVPPREASESVLVDRRALFDFLCDHGGACEIGNVIPPCLEGFSARNLVAGNA